MAITVLITRQFKKDAIRKAFDLFLKLRSLATLEAGYISGQTMASVGDPNKIIVLSTWDSKEKWEAWMANDLRKDYSEKMQDLMEGPETVEVLRVMT
ncbi:putative quinol monooxygenase [Thermodesulfobacteriota bacterium]